MQRPQASSWPPPWDGHHVRTAPAVGFPPPGAPSPETLDYTVKAITAFLLILALPAVVTLLVTNPGRALAGAGSKHLA